MQYLGGGVGEQWSRLHEFASQIGHDVGWMGYAGERAIGEALGGQPPDMWLVVKVRPTRYPGDEHPGILLVKDGEARLVTLELRHNFVQTTFAGALYGGVYREQLQGSRDPNPNAAAAAAAVPTLVFSHERLGAEIEHVPTTEHELGQRNAVRSLFREWSSRSEPPSARAG